jgi:hypothetical protein
MTDQEFCLLILEYSAALEGYAGAAPKSPQPQLYIHHAMAKKCRQGSSSRL